MSEKIKSSVLSFPVFFEKINDYSIEDDRFTRVKVYLMHTGLNFNNSIFDKNVINDAIPTLEYIPIVGFIEDKLFEDKDFTGHKYIITKDEKGVRKNILVMDMVLFYLTKIIMHILKCVLVMMELSVNFL